MGKIGRYRYSYLPTILQATITIAIVIAFIITTTISTPVTVHFKQWAVNVPTLSPLVAPGVAMTTYGAASDDWVNIMATLGIQC